MKIRVGFGYDVHRLVKGRQLCLGGVKIDYHMGLLGHSDADVVLHALCDAMLGAANMRDIGYHFPDNEECFKDIDSKILLQKTINLIGEKGYKLDNTDITICAQQPKLMRYIPAMQMVIAQITGAAIEDVSIKATTTEQLGFVGREEGIAAYAVVLIRKA